MVERNPKHGGVIRRQGLLQIGRNLLTSDQSLASHLLGCRYADADWIREIRDFATRSFP